MLVREILVLNDWSGGLCDDPAARDLRPNELTVANNVDVSKLGILPTPGLQVTDARADWTSILTNSTVASFDAPGYGLYMFGSDYGLDNTHAETYVLAVGGRSTGSHKVVTLIEQDGTTNVTTSTAFLVIADYSGSTPLTNPFRPVFYYVDDGLRVCDGNLDDSYCSNRLAIFINQEPFKNTGAWSGSSGNTKIYQWISIDNLLSPPETGFVGDQMIGTGDGTYSSSTALYPLSSALAFLYMGSLLNSHNHIVINAGTGKAMQITGTTNQSGSYGLEVGNGTATFQTQTYYIFPPTTMVGFNADITISAGGSFSTGAYNFAMSLLYNNGQESKLRIPGTLQSYISVTASSRAISVRPLLNWASSVVYNKGITGGRIYYKKYDIFSDDEWRCLASFDLEKGVCPGITEIYTSWIAVSAGPSTSTGDGDLGEPTNSYYVSSDCWVYDPPVDTYKAINGYDHTTDLSLSCRYKTAVIANRRAYVGNVLYNNKFYPDSVFKSKVNRFDSFDFDDRLEVIRGDGDSIVKLESYADRLLVFKKRKLYIINIAQEVEFVEAQLDFMGVDHPAHVTRTEYGIVWFNTTGAWLYDGNNVVDIFADRQEPSRRKINLSTFRSFLSTTPQLAYDARFKKVILVAGSTTPASPTSAANINMMIYDLRTSSWSKVVGGFGKNSQLICTNFVTDWSGFPITVKNDQDQLGMLTWQSSGSTSSSNLNILSGDLDFGEPGTKKNLVAMHITYKGSNLKPYFYPTLTSGSTIGTQYFETTANSQILPTATTYKTVRMTPVNPGYAKNMDSIQIGIASATSTAATSYTINDISLVYRKKGRR